MVPDWQLPKGVDRGLHDYVSSPLLAQSYDEALANTPLLQLDLQFAAGHLPRPGRMVDFGCGTGRACLFFAQRGFTCLGVDLSTEMLACAAAKAQALGLSIGWQRENLVELDGIETGSADAGLCLFSTLGMIRGREHRQAFLRHAKRIVRPGGTFIVHAHNARFHLGIGLGARGEERGDRRMSQARGGAAVTLHHYTKKELREALVEAGFRISEWRPISTAVDGRLPWPWLLPQVRAYGFLVAAQG
jgi:SAM-dependent methyltransferase